MTSTLRRTLLASAALLGALWAVSEPVLLQGHTVGADAQRVSIGALRIPLVSLALAQAPAALTLEDVTFTVGPATYRMRRMEVSGLASTRAELDALFDRNSTEPLAARLGRIGARQIAIPELTVEQAIGKDRQTATYRNVMLTGIERGHIRHAIAESASGERQGPQGLVTLTAGRLALDDVAATEMARIYTERGEPGSAMARIYGAFAVEDVRVRDEKDTDIRMARIGGRDIWARPTRDSWAGTASLIQAFSELDAPGDDDERRIATAAVDLFGALEVGQVEATGLTMKGRSDDGPVDVRLARMAYTGARSGQTPDARMEGFEVIQKDGHARIGLIAATGFSFQSTLSALPDLIGKDTDQIDAATLRKLIPTIGTLRYGGIDFDVPNKEAEPGAPERIRFGVREIEFTAEKPLEGIPTHLRFGLKGLTVALPRDSKEEGVKDLVALGYKDLDLSLGLEANWNEAGNELLIQDLSASGAGIGSIRVRGTLGNVTKDVFNPDTAIATVALVGATAKSLTINVENTGLFDRYLAEEARKSKRTPESLRREYGGAAAFAVPMMLGGSQQAKTLGQAVARFIARPTRLSINARTKSPEGLGLADLGNLPEPQAILDRLDITAATDEPL
ncbi:MAG TPA: hypothetical protein VIL09_19195 [Microvirga sp.]|jgi:hypothetical protein